LASDLLARYRGGACVVSGTCRTDDKAAALTTLGIDAHVFDTDGAGALDPRGLDALVRATHVVSMVPPIADFDRDPVLTAHIDVLLTSAPSLPRRWLGYSSTTGVYGDHQGAWVDESSPCHAPPHTAPYHRLAAERWWLSLPEQSPHVKSHVFRLAGIYGPGRSALDTRRRQRDPPSTSSSSAAPGGGASGTDNNWVSRIHVADICGAIIAAMQLPDTGSGSGLIFNVADDEPSPRATVMAYARQLLSTTTDTTCDDNGTAATASPAPETERSRRRRTDNKRVSNRRLRDVLGYTLRYPSYRDGLSAIHRGDTDPFTS
jgi:nucleoside-diphosphate-sugar epimerase